MEFKEVQKEVVKNALDYGQQFNITIDKEFTLLKLVEEVGEYMQSVLIHDRKSRPEKFLDPEASKEEVAKELADVIGMAMLNAHVFGIDLEEALTKKWINNAPKTLDEL